MGTSYRPLPHFCPAGARANPGPGTGNWTWSSRLDVSPFLSLCSAQIGNLDYLPFAFLNLLADLESSFIPPQFLLLHILPPFSISSTFYRPLLLASP